MFQPAETRHPPLEAHLRKAKALDCSHATQSYATAVRTRLPETDAMRLRSASRAELAARLATPPAGHGESCPLTRQLSQLSWKIYTRESIERASERSKSAWQFVRELWLYHRLKRGADGHIIIRVGLCGGQRRETSMTTSSERTIESTDLSVAELAFRIFHAHLARFLFS